MPYISCRFLKISPNRFPRLLRCSDSKSTNLFLSTLPIINFTPVTPIAKSSPAPLSIIWSIVSNISSSHRLSQATTSRLSSSTAVVFIGRSIQVPPNRIQVRIAFLLTLNEVRDLIPTASASLHSPFSLPSLASNCNIMVPCNTYVILNLQLALCSLCPSLAIIN